MLLEQMMGKSEFIISSLKGTVHQVTYITFNKHLSFKMIVPKPGKSEFCFPKTPKECWIKEKQNSLFPVGPVINKCFVIPSDSKTFFA